VNASAFAPGSRRLPFLTYLASVLELEHINAAAHRSRHHPTLVEIRRPKDIEPTSIRAWATAGSLVSAGNTDRHGPISRGIPASSWLSWTIAFVDACRRP
jgi:hypothetical protein